MDWTSKYLSEAEFALFQQIMFHRWYEHFLKVILLHKIEITERALDGINLAALKKVEMLEDTSYLENVKYK